MLTLLPHLIIVLSFVLCCATLRTYSFLTYTMPSIFVIPSSSSLCGHIACSRTPITLQKAKTKSSYLYSFLPA